MINVLVIVFTAYILATLFSEHIPKRGRDGEANGEEITAVITNTNKAADKAVTLRAEADGRTYKVKIKPTEARLWIKGDPIKIVLSEDKKTYRVLFNDYFRENEARLRAESLSLLEKKVKEGFISARMVEYKKENLEDFKASKMDSQRIFVFVTLMRMIDVYTVVTAILAVAVALWGEKFLPDGMGKMPGFIIVLLLVWGIYSSVKICKKLLKEAKNR